MGCKVVHSAGRVAGGSIAGLYAISRRKREQSAGKWGNLFQNLAGFFFWMKLKGTAASSLFLKTI